MLLTAFQYIALFLTAYGGHVLTWGWLFVILLVLWMAWEAYRLLKAMDYVSAIQWTFLQITVPEENPFTPKAMENVYDVISGIHKAPDLAELFFEGYVESWFSCELHCEPHRARYIMVVPTMHRKFFEGVLYGQYPTAEIREVEDYTKRYHYEDIEKKFDMYGTEVETTNEEIYPIRTYREYEDTFAEDDKFIDPHQALVEAYTNIREGEEFWLQILIRPIDPKIISKWEKAGEQAVATIAGMAKEEPLGILPQVFAFLRSLPVDVLRALFGATAEVKEKEKQQRFVFTPLDSAKMEGILQKVSRMGFKTKIRIIHISPPGKLVKPSISTANGALKQFSTAHLNGFKPDNATKTNGPNYFFKLSRRRLRKRKVLLNFQWRDFWGREGGYMMNAEELATVYHFPVKQLKAPAVQRAASGLGSAPENVPYA